MTVPAVLEAPEASPKTREEKRLDRVDCNDNGRVEMDDLLSLRRKSFAEVDKNGKGNLSFEEWTHTTIDKFGESNADKSGWLTRAEYSRTAPKRRPKKRFSC